MVDRSGSVVALRVCQAWGGSRLLSLFLGMFLDLPLNAAAEPDLRMEGLVVIGAAIGHDIVR